MGTHSASGDLGLGWTRNYREGQINWPPCNTCTCDGGPGYVASPALTTRLQRCRNINGRMCAMMSKVLQVMFKSNPKPTYGQWTLGNVTIPSGTGKAI